MYEVIDRLIDAGSWFEIKRLFAQEVIVGFARLGGRAVGIVANQPKVKGGVLMVDSSDKAARFIWLCNAFNLPLVYLADIAGFMVGTKVEQQGIIRHGAKMVFATAQATVPKISVIVRKCYGAGLYAMCGPAFEPDAAISLPQGQIAIMGPEPAVNAVYYNKIMELPESERAAWVKQKRDEYVKDVDTYKLASEMLIDDIVPGGALRDELIKRLAFAQSKAARVPGSPERRLPRLKRGGSPPPPPLRAPSRNVPSCPALHYFVRTWRIAVLGIKCAKSETTVRRGSRTPHDPAGGVSLPGLDPHTPALDPGRGPRRSSDTRRPPPHRPARVPALLARSGPAGLSRRFGSEDLACCSWTTSRSWSSCCTTCWPTGLS